MKVRCAKEPPSAVRAMNISATTLRPRNRRKSDANDSQASRSSQPSVYRPKKGSVSSTTLNLSDEPPCEDDLGKKTQKRGHDHNVSYQQDQYGSSSGIWDASWASLRGAASNIFSGTTSKPISHRAPDDPSSKPNSQAAHASALPRSSFRNDLFSATATTKATSRYLTTTERRLALLTGTQHEQKDFRQHKRRGSDDENKDYQNDQVNDRGDVLVYVHKVAPTDTLAGISIKYNCPSSVLRRANRLWPNDSIQVKTMIFLPLDVCGVRGSKSGQEAIASQNLDAEVLGEDLAVPPVNPLSVGAIDINHPLARTTNQSVATSPALSVSISHAERIPRQHDSWVLIEGFPSAVEIVRVSRQALGFFPPSIRKSPPDSDISSPTTSFELSRVDSETLPCRDSPGSHSRSNTYLSSIRGPGGVGTMARNVRRPGPANDGLNKLFPNLQPNQPSRTTDEFDQYASSSSGPLDDFSGVVEGWVRRLATKASTSLQAPPSDEDCGTLIELSEDAFEGHGNSLKQDHRAD